MLTGLVDRFNIGMKEREELRLTMRVLAGWSFSKVQHAILYFPGSTTWDSRFGHTRCERLVRPQVRLELPGLC